MIVVGLPRSYFYRRIAADMRAVLERHRSQGDREPEMVMKVNVQDALNRLVKCPVCGGDLHIYPDYMLERACSNGCGDFVITEVWSDGDVTFSFKMTAEEKMALVESSPEEVQPT